MKSLLKLVIAALATSSAGAYEGEEQGKPDREYCKKQSEWIGT